MTRQLFSDLIVSHAHSRGRRSRASLPLSIALHGAGAALLLALPLIAPLELPEASSTGPLVLRLPQPVPVVHAAARALPASRASAATTRSAPAAPALRPATQAAPGVVPDGLPAPDDSVVSTPFDDALPFGSGCSGPGCVPGLDRAFGSREPAGDDLAGGGAGGARTFVAGHDVSPPLKLHDVPPVYPELARRIRVAGVVVIACTIAPDGRVADAHVLSGLPLLDASALEAVRQWRYRPTLVGGAPVAVALTVTVHFRLER